MAELSRTEATRIAIRELVAQLGRMPTHTEVSTRVAAEHGLTVGQSLYYLIRKEFQTNEPATDEAEEPERDELILGVTEFVEVMTAVRELIRQFGGKDNLKKFIDAI
jgi:hypothetical protein